MEYTKYMFKFGIGIKSILNASQKHGEEWLSTSRMTLSIGLEYSIPTV